MTVIIHDHLLFIINSKLHVKDPREIEAALDLHGHLLGLDLFDLSHLSIGLATRETTTPVTLDLLSPLVEVGLDRLNQLVQGLNLK